MNAPLLLVGQTRRSELAQLVARLRATTPLATADDLATAATMLADGSPIPRVLLAPSFRGEFPEVQLRRLVRQQPLAEWIVVVGPWIEGETRSGEPWPGAHRMYLDQIVPWAVSSCHDSSATRPVGWRPATWTSDERWLELHAGKRPAQTGTVLVCGELAETRRSLAAVCAAAGWRTVTQAADTPGEWTSLEALIYDAVADRRRWEEHVRQLAQRCRPRALVVLMNFPRPDETQAMLAAGATSVLGKPFRVDDLLVSLQRPLPLVGSEPVC
jgi:CheY-like chemotaxis protein